MYLTDKKVAVLGAGGAIGSTLVQDLLSTGTASRIAMYDPYALGLEGAAEEIYHCAYPGARVTWTTDEAEALRGASYVISSGGFPRKEGMTREDLLKGNCEIAKGLGETAVRGAKLTDILAGAKVDGKGLSREEWGEIQEHVRNGGARIIKLRGRSSYQSPAHQSVEMLRARITNGAYAWPCGIYFGES